MPSPLVEYEEFETWLDSEVEDVSRAVAVLSRVSSLVRSEGGTSGATWGVDDVAVPEDVATVVLEVAKRVYQNPRNARTQTTEPYSVTHHLIGLSLTSDEKAMIAGAARVYPRTGYGLWALGTTRDDPAADTEYVPVEGTTTEFPWYGPDVVV